MLARASLKGEGQAWSEIDAILNDSRYFLLLLLCGSLDIQSYTMKNHRSTTGFLKHISSLLCRWADSLLRHGTDRYRRTEGRGLYATVTTI